MSFSVLLHDLSTRYRPLLAENAEPLDLVVTQGLRMPLLSALVNISSAPKLTVLVVSTSRELDRVQLALESLNPDAQIAQFPAWETLPHERQSPSSETVGSRYELIYRLKQWQKNPQGNFFVLAPARAVLQQIGSFLGETEPLRLALGNTDYELQSLVEQLVEFGYSRVDLVSRRGEIAVRGGILDIFAVTEDRPVRVDFFGAEIDSLKYFNVADQRSLPEEQGEILVFPAREILLNPAVQATAKSLISGYPAMADLLEKVSNGIAADGFESLAGLLGVELRPFSTVLGKDATLVVVEPEKVAARIQSLSDTDQEFYTAAWDRIADTEETKAPLPPSAKAFLSLGELAQGGFSAWWNLRDFRVMPEGFEDQQIETVNSLGKPLPNFRGTAEGGFEYIAERLKASETVLITGGSLGMLERTQQLLSERNIPSELVERLPERLAAPGVYLLRAELEQGFELPESKLVLLTEADLFGRTSSYAQRERKVGQRGKNRVDPLQLKAGDYVVHNTHGVGRFIELTKRKVKIGGRNPQLSDREYLVLEYAASKRGSPADKLYVPTDQLDLLSRYVGGEAPALSKLGGSDWAAAKSRARKAVRELAVDLVKLYSARLSSRGHAFSKDTPWQSEMEDAFNYLETVDQMSAIEEVKADMERETPMDRLVLGDVGYGKTEIAVRAAFKAVQDGKQVALLVPTTLLVRQHFETFQERFAGFPVNVRPLSRFQTAKESEATYQGLSDGTVDVVIGTHRILGNKVKFKDLGLLIIDEEQRFGVDHKEALKALKTNVDLLSMSATPIPRTLEMAITGIREMSTLNTAPEDRHPILTFVGPRNPGQIAAAIRRELLREGQVFFLHNRVSSINRVAAELAELVPEARIAIAHGKLSEGALEQVIVDFWENKFDVLVCTTIIETGIDIPNANTLIIDEADKYGLSQLHQIRGRVGRSRERAYAYFLYDQGKTLSEVAYDRLATIAANNELGAGMQVAMKDLELRGAGDLLGAEQSGHIAGVGFDLYLRMISEAVGVFKGEPVAESKEIRIELPVRAFLPESYLGSERLRLEAYQKLSTAAASEHPESLDEVATELVDRYGEFPEQVTNLFKLAALRQLAESRGLSEVITLGGNQLRLAEINLPESGRLKLARLYSGARYIVATQQVLIPLPDYGDGAKAELALIAWVETVINTLVPEAVSVPV
ncbi:MAG: transcription-repair coupling factor [Microbacteriaceae bacterium]